MRVVWRTEDEHGNEAELDMDGDMGIFTVSDPYESTFIALKNDQLLSLFNAIGNSIIADWEEVL